jgi:hypothetical protein
VKKKTVVSVAEGEDPLSMFTEKNSDTNDDIDDHADLDCTEGGDSTAAEVGSGGGEILDSCEDEKGNNRVETEEEATAEVVVAESSNGVRAFDESEDDAMDDEDTRRRFKRLAFSVTVFLPSNGRLGIGISELADGYVSITRLDRGEDGDVGCAEAAGLAVHDRLLGK